MRMCIQAMLTALRLREYDGLLRTEEIYSLIALTSFYAKFYAQCSRAFMKLETLPLSEPKKAGGAAKGRRTHGETR